MAQQQLRGEGSSSSGEHGKELDVLIAVSNCIVLYLKVKVILLMTNYQSIILGNVHIIYLIWDSDICFLQKEAKQLVLSSCGIFNSVAVLVFSRPKTEDSVLGLVLALKCVKICKSARSAFYSPGPHVATRFYAYRVIQNGGFSSKKMCVVLCYSK